MDDKSLDGFPKAPPSASSDLKDPKDLESVDSRIYLEQKSNKWIFEREEDGISREYEYDFESNSWILSSDDKEPTETIKRTVSEAEIDDDEEANKQQIKRIRREKMQKLKDEISRLKAENKKKKDSSSNKVSNAVYVSQLPNDITKEELVETFSKYGILSEDFNSGQARIKMYYNGDEFKGEALIFYHTPESVNLAIEMLDNTYIRQKKDGDQHIKVEPAQFDNAKPRKVPEEKHVLSSEARKLLIQKKEEVKKRLTQWDDDVNTNKSTKQEKTVLIRNMFRKEELQIDPMLELDLKDDIQEECAKLGIESDITKIAIYDITGVVSIRFKRAESCQLCISKFNGRYFDGLKLEAAPYNGQKLQKTNAPDSSNDLERLERFGKAIESR
ncbi:uncharacterized protein RJT20DRAFT_26406 [Scheffersomyces xylosifermentans]|uniref:uncharacterized protein n=1 Tax=Scheffersomyces xylosifermentans TaxID=1304137 RepID=UPI00315DD853